MIFNMNSGIGKKVPILDESYPENVTNNIGDVATFEVKIKEEGKPAAYTYQWYVNDNAVAGGNEPKFTYSPTIGTYTVYCIVTNEAGSVKSRVVTLTVNRVNVVIDGNLQNGGSWGSYVESENSYIGQENGVLIVHCDGPGIAVAWSSNKFDFTKKNRLIFYVQHFANANEAYRGIIYFGASDTLDDHEFVAYASVEGHNGNGEYISVDVTHLSGAHYIIISIVRNSYYSDTILLEDVYFE